MLRDATAKCNICLCFRPHLNARMFGNCDSVVNYVMSRAKYLWVAINVMERGWGEGVGSFVIADENHTNRSAAEHTNEFSRLPSSSIILRILLAHVIKHCSLA